MGEGRNEAPAGADAVVRGPVAAGALEAPATGLARRAVLLVPPIGREQVVSTAGLVVLSSELARRGSLVLRLSLRGTGDSHGLEDAELREAWRQDVRAALRDLRRRAPGLPVQAVGLRLGGAVLLDACTGSGPEAGPRGGAAEDAAGATAPFPVPERALLWEPVGGRAQLRRDVALRRVSVPRDSVDDGVEITGMLWTDAQAQSLRTIPDPSRAELPSDGWRLRVEQDREAAEMLWGVGSEFSRVPRAAIAEIVEQLTAPAPGEQQTPGVPVDAEPVRAAAARPTDPARDRSRGDDGPAGRPVVERHVRLPDGRPAILSAPERPAGVSGATAVQLIAASSEPADGPTGLWAIIGRELAARGLVVLRAERPGCGILTDPQLDTSPNPYDPEVIRTVREDAAWLRDRTGLPVTSVGLCVGSWLALRAADRRVTRRVVAVNNVAWRPGTGYYELIYSERGTWENAPPGFTEALTRDAQAEEARPSVSVRLYGAAKQRLRSLRDALEPRLPAPARLPLALLGLTDSVGSLLALPRGAREIDLVLGAEDMAVFRESGGSWGIRLAGALGRRVRVHDVPSLDHALLAAAGRRDARTMLQGLLAPAGDDGDRAEPTASGDAESGS